MLRIASYNTLIENYAKNNKPCFENTSWEERRDQIVDRITGEIKPDIICLQEIDRFDSLAEKMAEHGFFGIYVFRNNHEKEGCAIFYNKNRVSLLKNSQNQNQTVHFFNDGTGRMIQQVAFKMLHNNASVTLLNTHLVWDKWANSNADEGARRTKELQNLTEIADLQPSTQPTVVCGDFNIDASEKDVLSGMREKGYVDTLENCSKPTFINTHENDAPLRIDYIWHRNLECIQSDVLGTYANLTSVNEPSDHLPIVADFKIQETQLLPLQSPSNESWRGRIVEASGQGGFRIIDDSFVPAHKNEKSWFLTALKIIGCITLIFPFVLLLQKLFYRNQTQH